MKTMLKLTFLAFVLSLFYAGPSFAGTVWSVTIGNYPRYRPVKKTVVYVSQPNYVVINNCRPREVRRFTRRRIIYRPAVVITPPNYIEYDIHIRGGGFYTW